MLPWAAGKRGIRDANDAQRLYRIKGLGTQCRESRTLGGEQVVPFIDYGSADRLTNHESDQETCQVQRVGTSIPSATATRADRTLSVQVLRVYNGSMTIVRFRAPIQLTGALRRTPNYQIRVGSETPASRRMWETSTGRSVRHQSMILRPRWAWALRSRGPLQVRVMKPSHTPWCIRGHFDHRSFTRERGVDIDIAPWTESVRARHHGPEFNRLVGRKVRQRSYDGQVATINPSHSSFPQPRCPLLRWCKVVLPNEVAVWSQ